MRPEPFIPIYDLTNIPSDEEVASQVASDIYNNVQIPPYPFPVCNGTLSDEEFQDMLKQINEAPIMRINEDGNERIDWEANKAKVREQREANREKAKQSLSEWFQQRMDDHYFEMLTKDEK